MIDNKEIRDEDPELYKTLEGERQREEDNIELVASENFVSNAVREAQGSIMTNKYAEGYPAHRYYGGCTFVDQAEELARERLKKLFGAAYVNVQPHSGSQANMAAIRALINHGDKILGMSLEAGGHLTHGYHLSFSGKDYQSFTYGVDVKTGRIDYEEVRRIAKEVKPNLIIAGASAYPRLIDFKIFREIADEVGAYLMVDMAHIAGLVAAGLHPNPVPYAHVVTSTTHKTLRGPRGGIILSNDLELGKKIDKTVFPEVQGGPLEHVVAAKAVCFLEDLQPSFKTYAAQVIKNAQALADELSKLGFEIVTGGTDNHLLLVNVMDSCNLTGLQAQIMLEEVNITCNKNSIPGDKQKPAYCSGIRLGSPAMTTRGFDEKDFRLVGDLIGEILRHPEDEKVKAEVKAKVHLLTSAHPLPYEK
ncbi:MAG: serine hydroxymethyltransferase [Bacilli bacterium]|jgi:glycine hydroxymethyltransferase|nr:serine hydroxymethyltransferase [Bacilli bacterium]